MEFEELVDLHYRSLYRFGYSLSRNEATAADLVQQTFFRYASSGGQLRERGKAKAWLFTTLYREYLQLARKSWRYTSVAEPETLAEPEVEDSAAVVEELDSEALYFALGEVEDTFRAPLSLFYLEGLSYLEISQMLDVPVGTVMSRLSRGKARLRERLLAVRARDEKVVPFSKRSGGHSWIRTK